LGLEPRGIVGGLRYVAPSSGRAGEARHRIASRKDCDAVTVDPTGTSSTAAV